MLTLKKAAASNVIPIGLLYMRLLQWWLRAKGFSQRGNPLHMIKVTRQCLCALDMWRKPWFQSQGPMLRTSCRRATLNTGSSLTGWGAVMSGHSTQGLWEGHHLTWHRKLPGDADSVSCTKTLSPREVIMRLFAQTTHHWSITSTVRGVCFHATIQTGAPDLSVLSMRAVYIPRHLNQASRHPVETGAEVQGMKAPPQGCGEDLECVRLNSSCLVASQETSHFPF